MARILLKITFFIFLLFISNSALSQQREYIVGKLLDAKTQEPIAFASIRIKDRALGIISNTDGSFKIPLKYKEYGDIIEISSMGYQTMEILIYDFSVYELNKVRLQPAVIELEEAVVTARSRRQKKLSAKQIVQRAIDEIVANYPVSPYSQVGYYRDYQLDNGEYVNLNEAILEVHDQGFKAIDSSTSKVLLYDYKENLDFKRDTLARKPYNYSFIDGAKIIEKGYLASYGGNEFTILGVHNAIRNYKVGSYSFVNRLDTDLITEHRFFREDDASLDGEALYTIRFVKKLPNHTAYGRIYISKYDYAICQMEYAVYDETKENSTGLEDKYGSKKEMMFETNTSYRKNGEKMYLSYISFYNLFKLWEPPKLKLEYVDFRFDNAINNSKDDLALKRRWVVLTFNQLLDPDYVEDVKNFGLRFKGRKIALDGLLVSNNQVMLYPKSNTKRQIQMLEEIELLAKRDGLNARILEVKVNEVKDVDGNLVDEWTTKSYHQFREFFVQRVKSNAPHKKYLDTLFMNKKRAIFQDQPIVKPDNFDDYWMNTPLQHKEN